MLIMVMGLSFSANAQQGNPCNGGVKILPGNGPYLLQWPSNCGGTFLKYCNYNQAIALLNAKPGAQCISFICPDDSTGGELQF